MRYSHFLPENGSIGFISPSFGAATEPYRSAFLNARAKFEAMGYRCVTGPNAFVQVGVGISNTPEACAAEVNDFFTRNDTDILISLGDSKIETMRDLEAALEKSAKGESVRLTLMRNGREKYETISVTATLAGR